MFRTILISGLMILLAGQLIHAHDTWIDKRDGQLLVLRGHGYGQDVEAYDPSLVKDAKALDAQGRAVGVEIKQNKENASLLPKGNPVCRSRAV